VESSIKDVYTQSDIFWEARISPTKVMSQFVGSDEAKDTTWLRIRIICFFLTFIHLIVGFFYDFGDQMSNGMLLQNRSLEKGEIAFIWQQLMIFKVCEVSILIFLPHIMLFFLILVANKFLQKFHLPKLWKLLKLLHNLVKVSIEKVEFQENVIHRKYLHKD
jgi:hypothetical protein